MLCFEKLGALKKNLYVCFHGFFKSSKISSNVEIFAFLSKCEMLWNDPISSRVSVNHQNFTLRSRKQFCSFRLHRDLTIAAPETNFRPNFGMIKFQQIWNLTTPISRMSKALQIKKDFFSVVWRFGKFYFVSWKQTWDLNLNSYQVWNLMSPKCI